MRYRYACVVQLTEPDPRNDLDEGHTRLVAGKNEEGYSYDVYDKSKGDFVTIECEVVERVEAPERMSKQGVVNWATDHLNEEDYSPPEVDA